MDTSLDRTVTAGEWQSLWGITNGIFNCATSTYDVGCLESDCSSARIVAASINQAPYVINRYFLDFDQCFSRSSEKKVREYFWGGLTVYTVFAACRMLKARCKIHDDGQTSQEIPEDAGALIQLQNGEADIALIPLLVTESRSANFSYILSHVNKTYSIVIHKYFLTNSQSLNTEDHISPIIWFMIFLAITTLCSIIVLSHRLHLRNSTGVLSSLFATLMQAVWCEFDDEIFLSRRDSIKLAMITSLFLGLLCQIMVSTRLQRQLLISGGKTSPFSTLEGFLQSDFRLYGPKITKDLLQSSRNDNLRRLGERIQLVPLSTDFYKFAASQSKFARLAFLIHAEGLWSLAEESCDFIEAVSKVIIYPLATVWFRKHDPYFVRKFGDKYKMDGLLIANGCDDILDNTRGMGNTERGSYQKIEFGIPPIRTALAFGDSSHFAVTATNKTGFCLSEIMLMTIGKLSEANQNATVFGRLRRMWEVGILDSETRYFTQYMARRLRFLHRSVLCIPRGPDIKGGNLQSGIAFQLQDLFVPFLLLTISTTTAFLLLLAECYYF